MRPWIKVRLPNTDDAHQAAEVVESWRAARELPRHFARAILLYASLMRGDDSLLREYFPGIALSMGRPAVQPRNKLALAKVEYVERSEAEELSEALDLGFDMLEIDGLS